MTLLIAVHFAVACLAPLLVRVLRARAFFVLAAVPAVAFGWLVAQAPIIVPGGALTQSTAWIPTLGVDLAYRIGTLQWVLALIVTGVGALVLFYCRWYFERRRRRRPGPAACWSPSPARCSAWSPPTT